MVSNFLLQVVYLRIENQQQLEINFAYFFTGMESSFKKNKVIVEFDGQQISVGVQQGKQTFKWLALVLQTRIKELQQGKGSARVGKSDTGYLITGLLNENDELLDPRDCIFEHAVWVDGKWTIKAQTSGTFPSDNWGNPIYNEWTSAAYLNNEDSFRFMMEMDNWRMRLDLSSNGNNGTSGDNTGSGSNLIQIGDAPDVDTAFELDWSSMNWKWLPNLTEIQKGSLRTAMQARYAIVLALFRHYCGAGELGQRYGMTLIEFSHFVHLALRIEKPNDNTSNSNNQDQDIVHEDGSHVSAADGADAKASGSTVAPGSIAESKAESTEVISARDVPADAKSGGSPQIDTQETVESLLQEAFEMTAPASYVASADSVIQTTTTNTKSKYNRTKSDARWILMSRAHMAQALVYIAIQRNNNTKDTGAAIIDDVCNLLDGPLIWLWHSFVGSYTMYRNMNDETFVDALVNTYAVLKQAFLTFGSIHPKYGPTMKIEQCVWLFRNSLFVGSSMLDAEQEGACVSACLDSMLRTQTHSSLEFKEIIFSEFLEVLSSVALVSEHDSGMEVGKKMRLAFNTIAQ